MTPPLLESSRVFLEPLALSHSAGMFALWSHPLVCEHAGPCEDSAGRPVELPAASPADSDRLLFYWLERAREGTGFRWATILRERGEFLGAVGFNSFGTTAEYAYHFVPRWWGAGLATEASRAALSWAFSTGVQSVEAFIDSANLRSRRLAERLGFERRHQPATLVPRYAVEAASHTLSAAKRG